MGAEMTETYASSTDGGLRRIDVIEPRPEPAAVSAHWLRMVAPAPGELQAALHSLALPPAVLASFLGPVERSRAVAHDRALLATLRVVADDGARVMVLRAVCTPAMLVTSEEQALPAIDQFVTEHRAGLHTDSTLAALLIDVLEAANAPAAALVLSLSAKIEHAADVIEKDPQQVPATTMLAMKREVATLALLREDQSYTMMELQRHARVWPSEGVRELLRDLISDADSGLRVLARMEDRLRDLRQHQLQCLQESSNRRLNMLTILSAIYLPPTLIAGIYGMNLQHIPMTELAHGYLIVMLIMLVTVVGQLWFFHRRGWFD
jgi:magnesium transporter